MDKYNWEGISEPYVFDSNKLKKFEKNDGMSINIYCFDSMKKSSDIKTKKYIPIDVLYVSKYKSDQQVDLLVYQDGEDMEDDKLIKKTHVVWIKNLSRLISFQIPNLGHKCIICRRCLSAFQKQSTYDNHYEYCGKTEGGRVILPIKGKNDIVEFKHFGWSMINLLISNAFHSPRKST